MDQVRCGRCGHPLDASETAAGRCANCGLQIPAVAGAAGAAEAAEATRDDSSTRPITGAAPQAATIPPVPPLDAVTARAAPYAGYQPPALPRTGPRAPGEVPGAFGDPQAYPRRSGGPYESQENTAALPPMLSAEFKQGERERRPSSAKRLALISAIGLIVVLVLGAGGAVLVSNGQLGSLFGGTGGGVSTPTSTPAGGPPLPAGFVRYSAAAFSIGYPRSWSETHTVAATADLTYFSDASANATFDIETLTHPADPQSQTDAFINQFDPAKATGQAGTTTISNRSAPTAATLANQTWSKESADITVTSGTQSTTWQVVALATTHNQTTYVIGYFATQAVFDDQNAAVFQPMVASIQF